MGQGAEDMLKISYRKGVPAYKKKPSEIIHLIICKTLGRDISPKEALDLMDKFFINKGIKHAWILGGNPNDIERLCKACLFDQVNFKRWIIENIRDNKF